MDERFYKDALSKALRRYGELKDVIGHYANTLLLASLSHLQRYMEGREDEEVLASVFRLS